jgi:succinate dehydrogenase / fumarate reductase flavoprotein subunit/fumarate reductase (CoM/CoB) subunit A
MSAWDLIVVGSGGAGLCAAWHARAQGASVLVLNKSLVGRSGATITSAGGISLAGTSALALGLDGDPRDTEEAFLHDTLRAGGFLGQQDLAAAMVSGVGAEVGRLMAAGTKVSVTPRAPGHSSGRGVRIPGPTMQSALTGAALRSGVRFREDFQSASLLTRGGAVVGVAGLDRRSGELDAVYGRSVVLASGGCTSNWGLRTAPEELSGEGHLMALEAGAELIDMEMLQFLPCCLAAPDIWRGLQLPWILGPQSGIRAWLLNRYGERFMARWDPVNLELATRDVVAAASASEVLEGRGSPNGGVYLSWAHLPRDIVDNFPGWSKSVSPDWRWEGFEMGALVERIRAGQAIEVAPAAHFSLGGVRIDVHGSTGVPGLYACGEVTGGLHGANRLSGNAGAQVLVQGKAAGLAAAAFARADGKAGAERADNLDEVYARLRAPLLRREGVAPGEIKQRLTRLASEALGPIRNGAALTAARAELRTIVADGLPHIACRQREPAWNRDWSDALECRAGAAVLEAALLGAEARTASVGAHRRQDAVASTPAAPLRHGLADGRPGELRHRVRDVAFTLLAPA